MAFLLAILVRIITILYTIQCTASVYCIVRVVWWHSLQFSPNKWQYDELSANQRLFRVQDEVMSCQNSFLQFINYNFHIGFMSGLICQINFTLV